MISLRIGFGFGVLLTGLVWNLAVVVCVFAGYGMEGRWARVIGKWLVWLDFMVIEGGKGRWR